MTLPIETMQPPLSAEDRALFTSLWEQAFGADYSFLGNVMSGYEPQNRDCFFAVRADETVLATCHLTQAVRTPRLGGLGEVFVVPSARNQGLATRLCQFARDKFFARGGEHLFLGTENPSARRIYQQLGWTQLPNSTVMVNSKAQSTNSHIAITAQPEGHHRLEQADASIRIPLIPLALSHCTAAVLDANIDLISSAHCLQHSCMSLYPRYESLEKAYVVAAWINDCLVGIGSLCSKDARTSIDAFTTEAHSDVLPRILCDLITHTREMGIRRLFASLGKNDHMKVKLFSELGFMETGQTSRIPTKYGDFNTNEFALTVPNN